MWLSDYQIAIEAMRDVFQDACFELIGCSFDGSIFTFYPSRSSYEYYAYYRNSGRIELRNKDSWKHPDNIQVIREGK